MNNCFMDTLRDKTNLADSYGEVKNIPPLLICPNQKPRLPTQVLNSSILLKNANIDLGECYSLTSKNYNDTLYERNLPFGKKNDYWDTTPSSSNNVVSSGPVSSNTVRGISPPPLYSNNRKINMDIKRNDLPLKIDPRPVTAGLCVNKKSIRDRDMLDKMNEYKPNNNGQNCNNMVYVPGKGPVNHYFDNIDVESQLKNINEIDTKCSVQLFKVNPNDNNNNLSCYKDKFVKDYQKCEAKAGYTWCDYVNGVNQEQFPICDKSDFACAISKGSRKPKKITPFEADNGLNPFNSPPSESKNQAEISMNNLVNNRLNSGQLVSDDKLNRATRELYLVQRKRELDTQINMKRNDPNFSVNNKNITQYKSNGISNIIAPTIITQNVDEDMAKLLGERSYVEGILEKITRDALNESQREQYDKQKNINQQNNLNQKINPDCFKPIQDINLAKAPCIDETKNLYRFKNLVGEPTDDCYYCEQLFNNFTKRKNIVPNDPRFRD